MIRTLAIRLLKPSIMGNMRVPAFKFSTPKFNESDKLKHQFINNINYKAILNEEEINVKQEEFLLFDLNKAMLPFTETTMVFDFGQLEKFDKPILGNIVSQSGEMFPIGIVFDSIDFKSKELEQQKVLGKKSAKLTIKINKIQRFKLVSTYRTHNGSYATAIPYNDLKQPKEVKRLYSSHDIYEIFQQIDFVKNETQQFKSSLNQRVFKTQRSLQQQEKLSNFSPKQLDQIVWNIGNEVITLMDSLKFSSNIFFAQLMESRSPYERIDIIKSTLKEIREAIEIAHKSFTDAINHETKQYLSFTINRAIYYLQQQIQFEPQREQNPQAQSQEKYSQSFLAKKYLDKLSLIEDPAAYEKIRKEIERFQSMDKQSGEYNKLVIYLDEIFSLPYGKYSPVKWDLDRAKRIFQEEIYGLEKVKTRIYEMIAVNHLKKSNEKSKGFILLLNGPPGTGKTSIAKAIAKSLDRQSRFISCAGAADTTFFKGHKRTYVDSMPGIFIKEIIKAGVMNPVFILDEIDKVGKGQHGDPYYTLLEILNQDENHQFTDHYLDIPFDFSHCIFILTSNSKFNLLDPLKNRLEIIEIPAYIQEEKIEIANKYILKKELESNGLRSDQVIFDDSVITKMIRGWCYYEAGVRQLGQSISKILRKHALNLVNSNPIPIQVEQPQQLNESLVEQINFINQQPKVQLEITQPLDLTKDDKFNLLEKYLGPPNFYSELEQRKNLVFPPGKLNILTVGGHAGHVLTIESVYDQTEEKKGQISTSGNIQQILQESLRLAKLNAFSFLSEEEKLKFKESHIHVHFLEGSSPKDGPSAGSAITTALISLCRGFKISTQLAMTGEISLLGEICKVGGIQNKIIAAKTLGIEQVILPYANKGDALDLPKQLLDGLQIFFVTEYSQIYRLIFENKLQNYKDKNNNQYVDGVSHYIESELFDAHIKPPQQSIGLENDI